MEIKFSNIIFIIFILFTSFSKSLITNPVAIKDDSNIDDYIINIEVDSVYTSDGAQRTIIKDENWIKYKTRYFYLNPNFILCQDESSNYFLFMENYYYKIKPNSAIYEVETLELEKFEPLPYDIKYFGFIREKQFEQSIEDSNAISNINQDEVILYGKKEEYIYFYYIKESDYSHQIEEDKNKISCKFAKSACYICAYFKQNEIIIDIFAYVYVSDGEKGIKKIKTYNIDNIEEMHDYDNLIIYDTDNEDYKILCAAEKRIYAICKEISLSIHYDIDNFDDGFSVDLNIKDLN